MSEHVFLAEEEAEGGSAFQFSPRSNRAGEINWRSWGREAFEEAAADGKLVLLSISAVWCHWCHVMDETTYSDPEIINRINSKFIPVRVDSDKRPDINSRYNQGGWPTTAFLTSSGRPVFGFTYAPPDRMAEILDRLSLLYKHRKDEVDVEVAKISAKQSAILSSAEEERGIDPGTSDRVFASVLSEWDREHGGLGDEPKFPPIYPVELSLARFLELGDGEAKSFVLSTLDGMRSGELYDSVEGGFFRYSTMADWSVPHYEKMLAENAGLISIHLAASGVFDRPEYAEVARGALDYAISTLLDDEQRGFFGSQDADEDYYQADREGRTHLTTPVVDRTIYIDSTSKMVSALVAASAGLQDRGLLGIAERITDFIFREGFRHEKGICHYFELPEASPSLWGQPSDQVYFLRALEDLYQATGKPEHLERAVELADLVVEHYQSERGWLGEARSVHGRASDTDVLDDIPFDSPDIVINGEGARVLLVLDALAPGRGYREAAIMVLKSLAGKYEAFTHFASGYALAVDLLEKGPVEIRVKPDLPVTSLREVLDEAAGIFSPRKVVRFETIEDYVPSDDPGSPAVIICSPGKCLPIRSADELGEAVAATLGGDVPGDNER